jgi:hypothetical protein
MFLKGTESYGGHLILDSHDGCPWMDTLRFVLQNGFGTWKKKWMAAQVFLCAYIIFWL